MFCNKCGNILAPETTSGELKFVCRSCLDDTDAMPEDTLMYEENFNANYEGDKFDDLEKNAPFDPAAFREKKTCPDCELGYLVKIYIGTNYEMRRVCQCGYRELPSKNKTVSKETLSEFANDETKHKLT